MSAPPWLLPAAKLVLLLWAGTQIGVSLWAIGRAVFWRKRAASPAFCSAPAGLAGPRRVLLVRPVSGADEWLLEALASVPAATALPLTIRIAVAGETDSAYPAAEGAVAQLLHAGLDASLVVTRQSGPNRKAAQLAVTLEREIDPPDLVVIADADVDLARSPLTDMLARFDDARVGAVWAPPVERAVPRTLGDRASQALLGASLHAFPLLAALDDRGMVGKLCVLRRTALDRAGGLRPLVSWLGEDVRLAQVFQEHGIVCVAVAAPAVSVARGRSLGAVIARYARWLAVIRAQRPLLLPSYPLLFFGTYPAVALALVGSPQTPPLALVAAALLLTRFAVARAAAHAGGRSPTWAGSVAECALSDGLLAAAFATMLCRGRRVAWKDQRFTFDRRGMLREVEEGPRASE